MLSVEALQINYCEIKSKDGKRGISILSLFQFNYCTIKSKTAALSRYCKTHFNSTIVRLKDRVLPIKHRANIFQFNHCAIKIWYDEPHRHHFSKFQINHCTIKST